MVIGYVIVYAMHVYDIWFKGWKTFNSICHRYNHYTCALFLVTEWELWLRRFVLEIYCKKNNFVLITNTMFSL